ncbi:MAG: hypothetical protein CMJ35_14115 [Phycisphaerae bacterium]|nr:hypothetical protein [Phycisphaerae bacterium]MBM91408.1 hypothetical protein [Phycisphaerae bacterium]MBM92724.1 hypothetical protein [Phycisphaerae bacterium]HCT44647.1 hypothetical protein [Phycisphaerales bacterium]
MDMLQKRNAIGVLALVAITGAAQAGIASALILDDFDSDPNDDAGGPGVYSTVIFNNPFNQGSDFSLDTMLNSGSDVGALIFNSGIGVEQGASIVYDNAGAGLSLNPGAMGLTGFELDFLSVDQGFTMSIELGNNGDGPSGLAGIATLEMFVPAGIGQTASFSWGDFIYSPNFDPADVDSITLSFNPEDGATASLDFIASEFRGVIVPTPGAVAIMGIGGLLIVSRRRA